MFIVTEYAALKDANSGLELSVHIKTLIFLFLNQNICCGYSKEPSQWDSSFEHPNHLLKLMGKKIFTVLHTNILWNWIRLILICQHKHFSDDTAQ